VVPLLMGDTSDYGISRCGEGNEDDAVVDPSYPKPEMSQTIDFYLG
jgi:hypothetical protein